MLGSACSSDLSVKKAGVVLLCPDKKESWTVTVMGHAGVLALSATDLILRGLALCGGMVEPHVLPWCQVPHA